MWYNSTRGKDAQVSTQRRAVLLPGPLRRHCDRDFDNMCCRESADSSLSDFPVSVADLTARQQEYQIGTRGDFALNARPHGNSIEVNMRTIEFMSGNKEVVRGVLFEPTVPRPQPAIIFAHGLLSTYQEFGGYPEKFSQRGYLVLAIDFRGHGASDGMRGLIGEARMVEDLQHALDFIEAQPGIDNKRIALFGHSLGGGAVICTTARDARVSAVVAGATVGRIRDEVGSSALMQYRIVNTINGLQKAVTHKSMYVPYPIGYKEIFYDESARKVAEAKGFLQRTLPADNIPFLLQQDAIACAHHVQVPALIVQGEFDRAVQHTSVRAVYDALAGEKELYEVKGSGHSVWTDWKGADAFEHIAAWMEKHLKAKNG
jgi:alpha-beta hydrolase superfamily lysophospholipase